MRSYQKHLLAATAALLLLLPIKALAESADSLKIDGAGTVTLVSGHGAEDGISSLQFGLTVDAGDGARVEFQFAGSAEVQEYRYDAQTKKLNIYIAGTDALFPEGTDTLPVGRVLVSDGDGGSVSASVSVVEGSLQYVCGTELKQVEDLELPGKVQIGEVSPPASTPPPADLPASTPLPTAAPEPSLTPPPTQNPGSTGGQGSGDAQGGNGQSGNSGGQGNAESPGNAGNQTGTGTEGSTGVQGGTAGGMGSSGNGSGNSNWSSNANGSSAGNGTSPGGNTGAQTSAPQPGDVLEESDGSAPEADGNPGEFDEDFSESGQLPSDEEADREDETDLGGVDWLIFLVVGAALLLAAVAVMAVAVLNRKPKVPNIWDE